MLDDFVTEEKLRIPESFKKNDDARLDVFVLLERQKYLTKSGFNMKKYDYLVMN